ncbi:MAG: substrate-binding domain-containing protein [Tissierellia bacterium]|nr:substrate-binding domain-containing protein [Tissierellia bacterium]
MKKTKKLVGIITLVLMLSFVLMGCTQTDNKETPNNTENQNTPNNTNTEAPNFDSKKDITVVARDSASGTRGAFHEIMKIKVKEGDTEVDKLVVGALEFDGTDKVITAVEGDKYAIGYISLGSVSNRITAAKVDGVEPTVANVISGDYTVSRPFLLVTKGEESELVKDFIEFTQSKQGQDITNEMKFVGAAESPAEYAASGLSGTIKVAGSTSVTPLMEKLQEAYTALNPGVTFEMQSNGSSQGIKAAMDGSYDIGMSSRELKDEEASELNRHVLAIDGIAVIINNENPVNDLSSENITDIYTGEKTTWAEVQ